MNDDIQKLDAPKTRYVFVERARCPACESDDLHTDRSTRQPDGSQKRHTTCRTCGEKFFVIFE